MLEEDGQSAWLKFTEALLALRKEERVQLYWADETSLYDDWFRPLGRAPRGLPVENFNHRRARPQRQSLIAAMSATELRAPWCFSGSLTAERMIEWLQQLRPQLGPKDVLLLDNAAPHRAGKVQQWLEENPMRILFLPPYSPEFNPIEKVWALVKREWRRQRLVGFPQLQGQLEADLQRVIEEAGKAIVTSCGYGSFIT